MTKFQKPILKSKNIEKKKNSKRGRLIIRNLPFSVTEETLKNHFLPYGEIKEINILKRADGKLIGCGFVEYTRKQSAAKAIHYVSGKLFMGRTIIVDWAIPKNEFHKLTGSRTDTGTKEEIKEESLADEGDSDESTDDKADESNHESVDKSTDDYDSIDKSTESESEEREELVSKTDKKITNTQNKKSWPAASHDIPEGKTVFLKNVPFNITNDELKACVEEIGPVYYAVICMDPLTEHSKGTAFVKFKNKNHAIKCLEADSKLKLKGTLMEAFPALHKNKLMNEQREKHPDKKKDNRNLYLIKEGAIVAGTSAAKNVSMSDMKKRLELELWKSNMLRNLNMFISKIRLIIHNLPVKYDDKMLLSLFKKHAPPKAFITEARVMRNLRQLDFEGKPISKEYGFVSFREHEHALAALRAINNNPTIFSENKRPIVAFSLENRAVMLVKRKRMEKSKLSNPLCPDSKKPKAENLKSQKSNLNMKKRTRSENVATFAGIESHPGQTRLTSKRKIYTQREIHSQNVSQLKRETKKKRKIQSLRKEIRKEPKTKPTKHKNKSVNEKQFSQLVNKYKQKILPNIAAKKWYETN